MATGPRDSVGNNFDLTGEHGETKIYFNNRRSRYRPIRLPLDSFIPTKARDERPRYIGYRVCAALRQEFLLSTLYQRI